MHRKKVCIDLILTKETVNTISSDFHKLMLTVFKIHYEKQKSSSFKI